MADNNDSSTEAWVIGANDLLLGDFVYLHEKQEWALDLSTAQKFHEKDIAEQTLQDINVNKTDEVVGAELVPLLVHANQAIELKRLRDRLREVGPTHRADLPRESNSRINKA